MLSSKFKDRVFADRLDGEKPIYCSRDLPSVPHTIVAERTYTDGKKVFWIQLK